MSKSNSLKTNNSLPLEKAQMRLRHLPETDDIYVLDCYAGDGVLWKWVKKNTDKNVRVLSIDQKHYRSVDIKCDNLKVLAGIKLDRYNVVDLDAYGCPFAQLQVLFNRGYIGTVFVTYIQTHHGNLPHGILKQAGFTKAMLSKAQTVFTTKPMEIMDIFLANNGITHYDEISLDRKHYLHFTVLHKDKGESNE